MACPPGCSRRRCAKSVRCVRLNSRLEHYALLYHVSSWSCPLPDNALGCSDFNERAEMTPNVQLYTAEEFKRLADATSCDIKACIGLPIIRCVPSGSSTEVIAVAEVSSDSCILDFSILMESFSSALGQYGLQTEASTSIGHLELLSPQVIHANHFCAIVIRSVLSTVGYATVSRSVCRTRLSTLCLTATHASAFASTHPSTKAHSKARSRRATVALPWWYLRPPDIQCTMAHPFTGGQPTAGSGAAAERGWEGERTGLCAALARAPQPVREVGAHPPGLPARPEPRGQRADGRVPRNLRQPVYCGG
eukprot:2689122-Pyramimonas_sp.AAC.1